MERAGEKSGARPVHLAAPRKIQAGEERRLIGRRIRLRRLFLKKTQGALAKSLGITYQVLQKYENGEAAVTESRLREIAFFLDVSLDYFSADPLAAQKAVDLEHFVESSEGIALNRAVAALPDAVRAALIMAVGAYCDSHSESGAPALTSWLTRISVAPDSAAFAQGAQRAVEATKVELAEFLGKTLRTRRMTQMFAGQILRANQARISTLARGDVRGVSLDKLLRYFVLLGWNVGIVLDRRPADHDGKIGIRVRDV